MAEVSAEQFKVDLLRQRIAQITVEYEDKLADAAIRTQVFKQTAEEANARVEELEAELAQLKPEEEAETSDEQ